MGNLKIEAPNQYLVSANADRIRMVLPPKAAMSPDEALALAAWLVCLAEPFASAAFSEFLKLVQNA